MNWTLKTEALLQFGTQRRLARQVGVSEDKLSKIIHGWRQPTETERKQIAKALGLPIKKIWS
jgi:lambda repressor-like predicted transcriptional regulator